ncbi:MAG TPA: putative peptidoglycan glycosyltransferase FtsW [Candidatus Paceibacterota bacterium]
MKKRSSVDKPLALLIVVLVVGGSMLFASAAFGLLARGATNMSSVVFSHLALGVGLGAVALLIGAAVDYHKWRRYAPYIYALAIVATFAVFLPIVGFEHGGARRWIHLAGFSLQPSEFLKIASILLAASYFAAIKTKVSSFSYGFVGFAALLAVPALALVTQPDIGTLGIISISVFVIFFAAGAPWKQIGAVMCVGIVALALVAYEKPYVRERLVTFIYPSQGQNDQSYQIKQSLIAVGSGGVFGRGFGQGIQKFTYLPEPMGDSIFAVAAEELGFVGAVFIVALFLAFGLRGYSIAARAPDMFGSLLAVGIATYLVIEAFINIASMLGVAPVTGIPLTFISQGGSAMLASLGSAGLLLSISRRRS